MSEEETTSKSPVSRREFLWYAWMSSIALFMAGSGGATLAYMYPRFKEGEFGGRFAVGKVDDFEDGSVTSIRDGKFFLVRQGSEFKALYQVCTHLGCLVRETNDGFGCPCHGSKFSKDGKLTASPAPRDLDEFPVEVVDGQVFVDTGTRNRGESRSA